MASAAQPSILDILKSIPATAATALGALKGQYLSGPPQGAPSAGVGSVLDQKNQQLNSMVPGQSVVQPNAAPQQTMPQDLVNGPYQYKPSGLSGVTRK
jgi:hypothetical protein